MASSIQAIVMECMFALGQGAGGDFELDEESISQLRAKLISLLEEMGTRDWDRKEGMERFRAVGRYAAGSGMTGFEALWEGLRVETAVQTPYCAALQARYFGKAAE